jgi:signal transduction histidine kinase
MFLNLLSNALEFTEDAGTLTVYTKNIGSLVQVVISNTDAKCDSGEEVRGGTLQPPPPAHPGIGGTPLSLSICYSIMQHHNGDILVNTVREKGTAFILRFPSAAV